MNEKTDNELEKLLIDTRKAIRMERFAAAGARPKDSSAHAKLRKIIARVQTEQCVRIHKTTS